jgi:hypothetical protein
MQLQVEASSFRFARFGGRIVRSIRLRAWLLLAASILTVLATGLLAPPAALTSEPQPRQPAEAATLINPVLAVGGSLGHQPTALAAAVPKGATFAGSTSQDSPVVIQVSRDGKRVARLVIYWEAKCTSGETLPGGGFEASAKPSDKPVSEHPYLPLDRSGRFKGSSLRVGDLGGGRVVVQTQDMSGKLGSSKGAGTWHAHYDIVDVQSGQKVDECDTEALRWTAPKPQGLFYGGETSPPGTAVVVQLSPDRRKVRVFRIGWSAPCTPEGVYFLGDALDNFRLSRRGRFGDRFSESFKRQDGGRNKFDYEIAGTVRRTKASGSFHVHVTETDTSGATTATCDSPKITWSAKQ